MGTHRVLELGDKVVGDAVPSVLERMVKDMLLAGAWF